MTWILGSTFTTYSLLLKLEPLICSLLRNGFTINSSTPFCTFNFICLYSNCFFIPTLPTHMSYTSWNTFHNPFLAPTRDFPCQKCVWRQWRQHRFRQPPKCHQQVSDYSWTVSLVEKLFLVSLVGSYQPNAEGFLRDCSTKILYFLLILH